MEIANVFMVTAGRMEWKSCYALFQPRRRHKNGLKIYYSANKTRPIRLGLKINKTIRQCMWLPKLSTGQGECLLLFYVLSTSYHDGYRLVTARTHGDFIVLPQWEARLPAQ